MVSKVTSIYAQVQGQNNNFSPNNGPTNNGPDPAICITKQVSINGSTLKATYTVPQGYTPNPATFNGRCHLNNPYQ